MKIVAEDLSKLFAGKKIFSGISFELSGNQCLVVIGKNGSGKTTLLRILSNLMQPSRGRVHLFRDDQVIRREDTYHYIGFVGPYLELYQDLTALENLVFFARMKKVTNYRQRISELMTQLGLAGREHDLVKTYSSGMKQRLKYVFALLNKPPLLFVDEPRSNLDEQGIETVYQIFEQQKKENLLIVASNDKEDRRFADRTVDLNG